MIPYLHEAFSFILAISILVTVHEFGHFWAARRCGVRVLKFSIGFGQKIFSWQDKQGTEYIVAAIPLGGYVKMADEREEPVPEQWLPQAFNRKPVWQRMIIVSAGPVANFLLAWLAYWMLNIGGQEGVAPIIGSVQKGSIAEVAGLEVGQDIVAVDGIATTTQYDVAMALLHRLGETGEIHLSLKYPDSNDIYESVVDIKDWLKEQDAPEPVSGLGIDFYYPEISSVVGTVNPDGPAMRAGLRPNDHIVSIDGIAVNNWGDVTHYIHDRAGQTLQVSVERGDEGTLAFSVVPETVEVKGGKKIGLIGIGPLPIQWPEGMIRHRSYTVVGAAIKALRDVRDTSRLFASSIQKLVTGHISAKNISGPLTIASMADQSVRAGLKSFVALLAMLSLSLGVMNLLPIPVLDGGHLLYYLIEAVTGKAVSLRIQEYGFKLGLFLIIALMLLAFYNDFMRL
jgi:regulator of sigma E protease